MHLLKHQAITYPNVDANWLASYGSHFIINNSTISGKLYHNAFSSHNVTNNLLINTGKKQRSSDFSDNKNASDNNNAGSTLPSRRHQFHHHRHRLNNEDNSDGDNTGLRVLAISVDNRELDTNLNNDLYFTMTAVLQHDYCKHHHYDYLRIKLNSSRIHNELQQDESNCKYVALYHLFHNSFSVILLCRCLFIFLSYLLQFFLSQKNIKYFVIFI